MDINYISENNQINVTLTFYKPLEMVDYKDGALTITIEGKNCEMITFPLLYDKIDWCGGLYQYIRKYKISAKLLKNFCEKSIKLISFA